MPTFANLAKPAVLASVHFPLVDRSVDLELNAVLPRLTTVDFYGLLQATTEPVEASLVHFILQGLVRGNSELSDAYESYRQEYRALNKQLIRHRGYGLEGDEEPALKFEPGVVLDWVRKHKPKVFQSFVMDQVSDDLRVVKRENGWTWATSSSPLNLLSAECAGRTSGLFPSRMKALDDAIDFLGLEDLVKAML